MTRLGVAATLAEDIAKSLGELERELTLSENRAANPVIRNHHEVDPPTLRSRAEQDQYRALMTGRSSDPGPVAPRSSNEAGAPGPSTGDALRRSWSRTAGRARLAAAPLALAVALSTFALVRLPSANTLWSEELTISSNLTTLESYCDPPELTFVESAAIGGKTTFVYALSGDGDGLGRGCLDSDISDISIEVCFNPELVSEDDAGRVDATTEPPGWLYAPRAAGSPKKLKWDWDSAAPNKGPWDPEVHLFSFTLDVEVNNFATADAYYKAGPNTEKLGEVQVPACPLPEKPEPETEALDLSPVADIVEPAEVEEPVENEPEEVHEPEPFEEEEEAPANNKPSGPVMINPDQGTKPPKPTPTPSPTPVAISMPRRQ